MPLGPANVHRCALAVSIPAYASVILCIIAEFCSIHPDWMVCRPNIATVVNNKRAMLNSTTETPDSRNRFFSLDPEDEIIHRLRRFLSDLNRTNLCTSDDIAFGLFVLNAGTHALAWQ